MKIYDRTNSKALTKAARIELAEELREELTSSWPAYRDGKTLIHLQNCHFGKDNLLLWDLPECCQIPYRYEMPYPNWDSTYGECIHNPKAEALDPSNTMLIMWADSRVFPEY